MKAPGSFLSDIKEIRRRAWQHLTAGAITQNYGGNVATTRVLLERILAQDADHANDMHDPVVGDEGRPTLER